jgi:cell division protein FtsL
MNTAIRAIPQSRFQSGLPALFTPTRPRLVNLILLAFLVLSAFSVIYIKDLNRRLFINYQTLEATHDKLYEDWGKLLLEQSTWSTQARVQKIASHRLSMNLPPAKEVVVLRLRGKQIN